MTPRHGPEFDAGTDPHVEELTVGDESGADDRSASELDDIADRNELRTRYYGLLQESRVIAPGVTVLLAFLFALPFGFRFDELDALGRDAYFASLLGSLGSVVCLLTPTAFHRVAPRSARSVRLVWAIRMQRTALAFLAIALIAGTICVARFVYADLASWLIVGIATALVVGLWLILPLTFRVRSWR